VMTTRNLFERPELLENQTRLIISADAKPRRLARSAARSAGQNEIRERSESVRTSSPTFEIIDNDLPDEIDDQHLSMMPNEINYDTDIEQEQELPKDTSCQGIYVDQCRRHDVTPSTYFLRHIDENEMTIRYCGLKPVNVKVMVPALKVNRTITKLDLRDNGLGSRGAVYIAELLKETVSIHELNLGKNDIGIHGTRKLLFVLIRSFIIIIILIRSFIIIIILISGCKALCHALNLNISVRVLHLDENRFNDDCAQLFADVINQNEYLKYINLNKNLFENETTGRIFGQALKENQTIEDFHIGWNCLTSKACSFILKGLATNIRLTTLDLSWNGAGLLAAKAVFDLLKTNTTLEHLNFENNRLNTECAVYLGKGLAKNEILKTLILNGNPLESSGCYAVLRPLLKHPTCQLVLVDVCGIIVNNDFIELVKELASVLPSLTVKAGREGEKENSIEQIRE